MTVSWTRHRFSGGVLALDVTNTVVHRGDPQKSFDRFEAADEIPRFAGAASVFCAVELGGRALAVERAETIRPAVIELREASDALFRDAARRGCLSARWLPAFLQACAVSLVGQGLDIGPSGQVAGNRSDPLPFTAALAVSALALLRPEAAPRIRICPNCSWLFLDRSRNASRLWCDMAVCGNRSKARRHYHRHKGGAEEQPHA